MCPDAFSFIRSEIGWRAPLAFQLVFVFVIFSTVFWLPESPRWLAMKNQDDKALQVMLALEGKSGTSDHSTARVDLQDIKRSIDLEQSTIVRRETKTWFRFILGVGVQAMQQATGINVICYYLPYVFTQSVGLNGSTARLLAAVNATTYFLSTFVGLCFVDRWGRRALMMYGALGQSCCWLAITMLLGAASRTEVLSFRRTQLGSAAVLFFFLFNFFFGASWQGVSWLYPTEINSTKHRIVGMSCGVAVNWLINFGVVFVTPIGIARLGPNFWGIWTVLNALMVPILYLFYPETAGRSLEDIDGMFQEHPTIWIWKCKSMTSRKLSTSNSSQDSGDDVPNSRIEEPSLKSSRSGIELASLSHLRHRQPGGAHTPLESTTPVQDRSSSAEGGTGANPAAAAPEEVKSGAETGEEDEDADVVSLRLTPGGTGLTVQTSDLSSPKSTRTLL